MKLSVKSQLNFILNVVGVCICLTHIFPQLCSCAFRGYHFGYKSMLHLLESHLVLPPCWRWWRAHEFRKKICQKFLILTTWTFGLWLASVSTKSHFKYKSNFKIPKLNSSLFSVFIFLSLVEFITVNYIYRADQFQMFKSHKSKPKMIKKNLSSSSLPSVFSSDSKESRISTSSNQTMSTTLAVSRIIMKITY